MEPHKGEAVLDLVISEISANPHQPRKHFDQEKLEELASSIQQYGVVQPIVVRKLAGGYELVAGERRWRASRKVGLKVIPAVVRDYSDSEMMEIALVENLQREDLNPIEEATSYKRLMEEFHLTQDDVSKKLGRSRSLIANTVRLLQLPETIQDFVSRGTISMGHARALLSLPDESAQRALCQKIVDEGLSVRQVEKLVKKPTQPGKRGPRRIIPQKDPDIRSLEEELQRALGTKVTIRTTGKRGTIEIDFYSPDEFDAIMEKLLEERPYK
jgi:ParB family chromosome partitioning protein